MPCCFGLRFDMSFVLICFGHDSDIKMDYRIAVGPFRTVSVWGMRERRVL